MKIKMIPVKYLLNYGKVDESAKSLEQIQEERQVVIHCTHTATWSSGLKIRIWPNHTFLIDQSSGHISKMIWFQNIPEYPVWKDLRPGEISTFTFVFEALPKSSIVFDLCELIPEFGGFEVKEIERNNMDVYEIAV